ncbi:MAG: GldG family protein, partial [Bdellovibrionota bacterium]
MNPQQPKSNSEARLTILLWSAGGALLLALLFARAIFPELLWLTLVIAVPLIGIMVMLVQQNAKALRSRSAAYGLNAVITVVLVIGIVGVLNFLASRYPGKLDLTKNKLHTLSEQTVKTVKGLNKTVKAVLFVKSTGREQYRALMENFKGLNPKFEVEYVDPDREPTRAKEAGIKKYGTLYLQAGGRDSKVEEPNEEKLTNALIKLLKEKTTTLCAVTGHGEKSFTSNTAEGYEAAKKALNEQSYEVKDVSLMQEGKVPETCDGLVILGPTKSFFDPEVKVLRDYLAGGGRAIIALDLNLKGIEQAPELNTLLADWHVKNEMALIVDPLSKMLGVDAAVPILATYNKENPITKDFQTNCYFPFTRPVEVVPGAPVEMKVQWLGQTTPKSWAVTDLKMLASGQIEFRPGKDRNGPLNVAVAVDGKQKDSKAPRNTRLVVFGTSNFATNNYQRFGGNMDFFLNAASWVMEDESLISIRTK